MRGMTRRAFVGLGGAALLGMAGCGVDPAGDDRPEEGAAPEREEKKHRKHKSKTGEEEEKDSEKKKKKDKDSKEKKHKRDKDSEKKSSTTSFRARGGRA